MADRLDIAYRHDMKTAAPRFVSNDDIQSLAGDVRRQIGCGAKLRISTEDLTAIREMSANGVHYELCWSIDGPVTNEQGEPVLGLCEYDHEGLPDTALIFANPDAADGRSELLISTLAHEFGHAIFEAPAWIVAARSAARRGLFASAGGRRYRSETPDEQHLRDGPSRPNRRDFSEWRANEFMGSLLVPRELLVPLLAKAAAAFRIPIEGGPATLNSAIRVARDLEGKHCLILPRLIDALASAFGVSRRFMRVRLVRYRLIEDFQLILC